MKLSRIGTLGGLAIVLGLVANAACSSSDDGGGNVVERKDAGGSKSTGHCSGDDTSNGDDSSNTSGDDSSSGGGGNVKPTQDAGAAVGAEGGVVDSGSGTSCKDQAAITQATQVSLNVTWKSTLAVTEGSGVVKIILLSQFNGSNNSYTGKAKNCRLLLPDVPLSGAAQVSTGGKTVQISFQDKIWDLSGMPSTTVTFKQSGLNAGSTLSVAESTTLIGVAGVSATDAWPANAFDLPGFSTGMVDPDGDGFLGFTANTKKDLSAPQAYANPPLGLGVFGSQATADDLYIAARLTLALDGKKTGCASASGKATVKNFDNHVVGCRVADVGTSGGYVTKGKSCPSGKAGDATDFVDQNRTIYVPGDATFETVELSAGSNCAAAINAFQGK